MAGQFVGLPERLQGTPLTSESYVPEKSYAQQTVQHGDHRITMTKALRLGIKLRVACEQCRVRKLRCTGATSNGQVCSRCAQDGSDCYFGT